VALDRGHGHDELVRVRGDRHDLEPGRLEHAHDALAHERLVLSHEHPDRAFGGHGADATPAGATCPWGRPYDPDPP
jgi:hypothetical protein